MYQYKKRLDCRALGKEIKRRRRAKGWTREHLAQLVDRTPRSIKRPAHQPQRLL